MSVDNKNHRVIESGSISQISELISNIILNDNNRVLLVCDIDDTLIRPVVNIGSDSWFTRSLKGEHINNVRKNLGLVYSLLNFSGVEKETDAFVAKIAALSQTDKLKYMCLTSRSVIFHSYTLMHFKDTGYDKVFVRPNVLSIDNPLYLGYEAETSTESLPQVRYIDNVCSCSGMNKGDVMVDILKQVYLDSLQDNHSTGDFEFDTIIFIDDSISNVNKMHLKLRGFFKDFPCMISICIHYTYMEEHKNNYSIRNFIDDNKKMNRLIEFKNYINNLI